MNGTGKYYDEFGKATFRKSFIKDMQNRAVPSKENSTKISFVLDGEFSLLEMDTDFNSYLKPVVCESNAITNI